MPPARWISSASIAEKHNEPMKNAGWCPMMIAIGQGSPRCSYFFQMTLASEVSETWMPSRVFSCTWWR